MPVDYNEPPTIVLPVVESTVNLLVLTLKSPIDDIISPLVIDPGKNSYVPSGDKQVRFKELVLFSGTKLN